MKMVIVVTLLVSSFACMSINSGLLSSKKQVEVKQYNTKDLLPKIVSSIDDLKKDKVRRNDVINRLLTLQAKLLKSIDNKEDKKKLFSLLKETENIKLDTKLFLDTEVERIKSLSFGDRIYKIILNLTSPRAILCTTLMAITFAVKGVINSGELSRILQNLVTILNRQIFLFILFNIWYVISNSPYLLKSCFEW
ncbi:hypothetical protein ACFLYH_02155 [Candidatus Dependentiae bacterium]